MKRISVLAALLVLISCVVTAAQPASSGLIEGAKAEAHLVLRHSIAPPLYTALAAAFSAKYPFITLSAQRMGTPQIVALIESEKGQAKGSVDIITTGYQVVALKKEGVLMQYDSPEAKALPGELKDADGFWYSYSIFNTLLAYNTKVVPPAEAPRSYDDLLDAKWKGKLGIDTPSQSSNALNWFVYMHNVLGPERFDTYMKKLATQNVRPVGGAATGHQLLAAGEIGVYISGYEGFLVQMRGQNAPVDWVRLRSVPVNRFPIAIVKNAPHPMAAKLWLDFTLSPEGQAIVAQHQQPARPGVQGRLVELFKDIDKTKMYDLQVGENTTAWIDRFQGYFGFK